MSNLVKRVAAIHDLSGFGRASLTVVIPVLSTMGIQVCPVPTAVLSAHGRFKGMHFTDLTPDMEAIANHWKKLNLKFDAIYSGFLGSAKQVEIVDSFIDTFSEKDSLVVVDPVLGDNGKLYGPIDIGLVDGMKKLVKKAKVVTPNLTELFFLLGKEYNENLTETELRDYILQLAALGPKTVIVTSCPDFNDRQRTAVVAYSSVTNRFWKVSIEYLPANYPGTGDAFTSVITGALLQGDSLPIALDRAAQFTSYGVRATFGYDYNPDEGILLEKVLNTLNYPVPISTYQIYK